MQTFYRELQNVFKENKNIFFDKCISWSEYAGRSGPASKLLFRYKPSRSPTREKKIHVDLVPAVQIPIREGDVAIRDQVRLDQLDPQWRQMLLQTGFYYMVLKYNIENCGSYHWVLKPSITDTEMDFMNKHVSRQHRIAYRFMKHFVNGRDGAGQFKTRATLHNSSIKGSMFEHLCTFFWYDMPSYALKTLLYQHVVKCESDRFVTKCVRDMLTDLSNCVTRNHGYMTTILKEELKLCDMRYSNTLRYSISRIKSSLTKLGDDEVGRIPSLAGYFKRFFCTKTCFVGVGFVFLVFLF